MILDVQTGVDNDVLRKKAKKITAISSATKKLARNMVDTMNAQNGIGIAGPQVGVLERIIIIRLNAGTKQEVAMPMINPVIDYFSEEEVSAEEGCLSLPGKYGNVWRSQNIEVSFLSVKGENRTLYLEDLNARIVQHEVDHLDGILFPDRVEEQKDKKPRQMVL